jgi:hypothetical protein
MVSPSRWQDGGATYASECVDVVTFTECLTSIALLYREDRVFLEKSGKRKAFHMGSNSSCRQHIRQHYEIYKSRCKEAKIPEHHWAIPRNIWREKQAKTGKQGNLDGVVVKLQGGPQTFTREGLRHAVCQFIACDDQVSITYHFANNVLNMSSRWPLRIRPHSGTVW